MPSLYWNREDYASRSFPTDTPITKEARIVALATPGDPSNAPLDNLPAGARVLAIGRTLEELDLEMLQGEKANVIYVSPGPVRETLASLMDALEPSLEWIHTRTAGIDYLMSDSIRNSSDRVQMTNAKGAFSSTLAEYALMACAYFAKDLPRLLQNKKSKHWKKYSVLELRGATMGIVGYGDIGRAVAKLAKVYGMRVIALRRNPDKATDDPYCDVVYGNDRESLNKLFSESDYVLCSAPLTDETKGMIGKDQFDSAKEDAVFINVGRGPIVDEVELIEALKDGRLKGAGLDVFTVEPLPEESELWTLENVLLSP
jgi:phosphoglycerate dehydrogenase-like enzyme